DGGAAAEREHDRGESQRPSRHERRHGQRRGCKGRPMCDDVRGVSPRRGRANGARPTQLMAYGRDERRRIRVALDDAWSELHALARGVDDLAETMIVREMI